MLTFREHYVHPFFLLVTQKTPTGWTSSDSAASSDDENALTIMGGDSEPETDLDKMAANPGVPFLKFTQRNVRCLLKASDIPSASYYRHVTRATKGIVAHSEA